MSPSLVSTLIWPHSLPGCHTIMYNPKISKLPLHLTKCSVFASHRPTSLVLRVYVLSTMQPRISRPLVVASTSPLSPTSPPSNVCGCPSRSSNAHSRNSLLDIANAVPLRRQHRRATYSLKQPASTATAPLSHRSLVALL